MSESRSLPLLPGPRTWRLSLAAVLGVALLALALLAMPATTSASHTQNFLVTPIGFDFGEVVVGETSPPQRVHITNVSDEPQTVNLTGTMAGVFGGASNCPATTLAPGDSCQLTYRFEPLAAGVAENSINASVSGQAFTVTFRGVGIADAAAATQNFLITPVRLDFGEVVVGATAPGQVVTVTNVSAVSHTMSGAGGAAGVFGGFQNCQGNTLAPGESCQITYRFGPTELGLAEGSTNGSWNGQSFSFSFRGTGVNPHAFVLETETLPAGTVGEPYSATLEATGGVEPYAWSVSVLPGGLTLDTASGVISGTPNAAASLTVTVQVTDNASTMRSRQLGIVINEPPDDDDEPVAGVLTPAPLGPGVHLASWSGGSIEQLQAAAPGSTSFWVTSGGRFFGLIVGAPPFANADFLALYPGGQIPPGTNLVVVR